MVVEAHATFGKPPVHGGDDSLNIQLSGARNPRISLRQWRVLHAVVDCGGFAQASEYLHLSQSAISYALAKLQEQLGVPLLRIEGRKAQLTEMGYAIMERSRRLIGDANKIEAFASAMERGWEPEIRLVVGFAFPPSLLMRALRKFARTGNGTLVLLNEIPNVSIDEALRQGSADLAISAQVPVGFLGKQLMEVEYVAVISPRHPLLNPGKEITKADLEQITQIVIRDFENPERRNGAEYWLHQGQCWNVAHFDTAIEAVREGLGFAWVLKYRVQELLDQGALVSFPLQGGNVIKGILYLIHGGSRTSNPGPAVSHLVEILHSVTMEGSQHSYSVAAWYQIERRTTLAVSVPSNGVSGDALYNPEGKGHQENGYSGSHHVSPE